MLTKGGLPFLLSLILLSLPFGFFHPTILLLPFPILLCLYHPRLLNCIFSAIRFPPKWRSRDVCFYHISLPAFFVMKIPSWKTLLSLALIFVAVSKFAAVCPASSLSVDITLIVLPFTSTSTPLGIFAFLETFSPRKFFMINS